MGSSWVRAVGLFQGSPREPHRGPVLPIERLMMRHPNRATRVARRPTRRDSGGSIGLPQATDLPLERIDTMVVAMGRRLYVGTDHKVRKLPRIGHGWRSAAGTRS